MDPVLRCHRCSLEKPVSGFSRNSRSPTGFDWRCKECKSSVFQAWKDSPGNRNRHRSSSKACRKRSQSLLEELKRGPCTDCGVERPTWAMEWDHLHDKEITPAKIQHQRWSEARIRAEISKCELVCVLCHRLRSNFRSPGGSSPDRDLVRSLKSSPCVDCGKPYEPCQMDFDHVGLKRANVSRMLDRYSIQSVLLEIQECELVCALCHRIRTHSRKDYLHGS